MNKRVGAAVVFVCFMIFGALSIGAYDGYVTTSTLTADSVSSTFSDVDNATFNDYTLIQRGGSGEPYDDQLLEIISDDTSDPQVRMQFETDGATSNWDYMNDFYAMKLWTKGSGGVATFYRWNTAGNIPLVFVYDNGASGAAHPALYVQTAAVSGSTAAQFNSTGNADGIRIGLAASTKAVIMDSGDKLCLDGPTCSDYVFDGDAVINGQSVCLANGTNCQAGAGGGNITAVNTNGPYLTGGAASGAVSLLLNETHLNLTITAVGAGGNSSEEMNAAVPRNTTDEMRTAAYIQNGNLNLTADKSIQLYATDRDIFSEGQPIELRATTPGSKPFIGFYSYDDHVDDIIGTGWFGCHYNTTQPGYDGSVHSHCGLEVLSNVSSVPSLYSVMTVTYGSELKWLETRFANTNIMLGNNHKVILGNAENASIMVPASNKLTFNNSPGDGFDFYGRVHMRDDIIMYTNLINTSGGNIDFQGGDITNINELFSGGSIEFKPSNQWNVYPGGQTSRSFSVVDGSDAIIIKSLGSDYVRLDDHLDVNLKNVVNVSTLETRGTTTHKARVNMTQNNVTNIQVLKFTPINGDSATGCIFMMNSTTFNMTSSC